jgi:methyl-accepting chemotaxis protein
MDLSKKFAFYFGATALVAVAVTIVCQMALTSVGGAILIALLVAPILGACAGYFFGRSLSRAVRDLRAVIERLTRWDTAGEVPHTARRDELGVLANALQTFQDDAKIWSESHQSELDSQIEGRLASQRRTEELIHQFRGSIAGLLGAFADSARQMDDTARLLSSVATDTTTASLSSHRHRTRFRQMCSPWRRRPRSWRFPSAISERALPTRARSSIR